MKRGTALSTTVARLLAASQRRARASTVPSRTSFHTGCCTNQQRGSAPKKSNTYQNVASFLSSAPMIAQNEAPYTTPENVLRVTNDLTTKRSPDLFARRYALDQNAKKYTQKQKQNQKHKHTPASERPTSMEIEAEALDLQLTEFQRALDKQNLAKAEQVMEQLTRSGAVVGLTGAQWDVYFFLIAGQATTFARMEAAVNTYTHTGLMLNSRLVQAVVGLMIRLIHLEQPVKLSYAENLLAELRASNGTIKLGLHFAMMQLYLDFGAPDKALEYGNSVVSLPGFIWNDATYHLFIRAHLSQKPHGIDIAYNLLHEMRAEGVKPTSQTIIAFARALVTEDRATDARLLVDQYRNQFPPGSRDEMYLNAYYLHTLAVAKDPALFEAYEKHLVKWPENSGFAHSAMITYHSHTGNLEEVFRIMTMMENKGIALQPAVAVAVARACASKGTVGARLAKEHFARWNSQGIRWWSLFRAQPHMYATVLGLFETPPGEGPMLTPSSMMRQLELHGVPLANSSVWIALLHYFSAVRNDQKAVVEILETACGKGLTFANEEAVPVVQFLLSINDLKHCDYMLSKLSWEPSAQWIAYAQILDYHFARNDTTAAAALVREAHSIIGTMDKTLFDRTILYAGKRGASLDEIFNVMLPVFNLPVYGIGMESVCEHLISSLLRSGQYEQARALFQRLVTEILKTQAAPASAFQSFISSVRLYLPNDSPYIAEANELIRRLENVPRLMGPAQAQPLLNVSIHPQPPVAPSPFLFPEADIDYLFAPLVNSAPATAEAPASEAPPTPTEASV